MFGETGIPGNQGEKVTIVSLCQAKYCVKATYADLWRICQITFGICSANDYYCILELLKTIVRFCLSICALVLITWLALHFIIIFWLKGQPGAAGRHGDQGAKGKQVFKFIFSHTEMSSLHLRRIFMFLKIVFVVVCIVCSREKLEQ